MDMQRDDIEFEADRVEETTSPCDRVPIEQVDCDLLDVALALSFEWRELVNLVGAAPGCACPTARSAVTLAHKAVHGNAAVARRLEAQLDLMHGAALDRLAARGPHCIAAALVGRDLREARDLAGDVWALGSSADPDAAGLRRWVSRALFVDGLLALQAQAEARA